MTINMNQEASWAIIAIVVATAITLCIIFGPVNNDNNSQCKCQKTHPEEVISPK